MKFLILIIIVIVVLIVLIVGGFFVGIGIAPAAIPKATFFTRVSAFFNPHQETERQLKLIAAAKESEKSTRVDRLDIDAHSDAYYNWCVGNGYDYEANTETGEVTCSYTKKSCISSQNLVFQTDVETGQVGLDIQKSVYLEWHNGKCVKTYPALKNYCNSVGFGYDQGDVECVDTGECKPKLIPTCLITPEYCLSKGLTFDDAGGYGDCYLNFGEEIAEMIVGSTVYRKYKQNYSKAILQCKSNGFSSECLSGIAQAVAVGSIIVFDTGVKFVKDRIEGIKTKCGNIFDRDSIQPNDYMGCAQEIRMALNPAVWLSSQAFKILEGLLCRIPGFTSCRIGSETIAAIMQFGNKLIDLLIDKGEVVARAIGQAFYDAAYAISEGVQAIGDGIVDLINMAAQGLVDGALYMATAFAQAGVRIYDTMKSLAEQSVDALQTAAQAIGIAFERGGQMIGNFIADVIITQGIDTLRNIGQILENAFGVAGRAVAQAFTTAAGFLADIGRAILHGIQDALEFFVNGFGSMCGL